MVYNMQYSAKGISFITVPIFTRMLSTEEYGIISLFGAWQSILTIFATLNLSNQIFNNGMVKYEKDQDGYTTAMLGLSNFATALVFMLYLVFHTALDKIFELPMSAIIMMFIGFSFQLRQVFGQFINGTSSNINYCALSR